MHPRLLTRLFAFLALPLTAAASALTLNDATAAAERLHLAANPYWRTLLRYENKDGSSTVRLPAFFLSPEGRRSPDAELAADLRALFTPAGAPDQSFACRFPARANWLRGQLGIAATETPAADCPALNTWMQGINPAQATLIFAADYLNNPSSMFGHTLLRIDAPDQNEETRLLAYAINYSAQTEAANSIDFAWKGLTGGYPGAFSILPYYQKVKEYNDFENRDLWEYQLNLSPEEIRRLLYHLWELKGVQFPYYFLSSNCSYQLLGLFEAARPGLQLRKDFPVQAIPSDTLRRVLAEPGMLKTVVYRPASGTLLEAHANQNSHAVNRAALQLAADPKTPLDGLNSADQARAIEMGYDDLYYRYLGHEADAKTTPPRLRELLIRRSTHPEPDSRLPPPRPAADPSQGHLTAEWQAGGGRDGGQDFVALDYRPAYHDLLDPEGGYRQGAAIDFLRGQMRWRTEARDLQLQQLTLVHIDSLAPRNDFLKPLSWNLGLGARQTPEDAHGRFSVADSRLAAYAEGGMGVTLRPRDNLLCFGLIQAALEGGKTLDDGWRGMIGPRAGCRRQGDRNQGLVQIDSLWADDSRRFRQSARAGWQWDLTTRDGLRVEASGTREGAVKRDAVEAGWRRYF